MSDFEKLHREKLRLEGLLNHYLDIKSDLPVGTIQWKYRGGQKYAYLIHRMGKKVQTDYVGKMDSKNTIHYLRTINRRVKIEASLKMIKADLIKVKRALKDQIDLSPYSPR